ncbi:MAG: tRNA pseudouridine(38-40) synthase TruA [Alphaproteobacteria bacterium]|nr:tRNA pseudouridine(38-40) synthase TruA [Alphaproteobacteria bacterium]
MTRFKLTLEYHGQPFVGWQRQDNGPSVQAAVEDAVKTFCGETVTVYGAGRTDAGVHAAAQVAHLDLDRPTEPDTVRDALNHHLRELPITVLAVAETHVDFHARFSATSRTYRYRILNRRPPPALDADFVWWVAHELDVAAMVEAARALVGRHDFTSFRASQCSAKSPVKTLDRLDVARESQEIVIEARARSFLHHQVRNFVGSLKLVGEGKWTGADLDAALAARDRTRGGPTAPPQGLTLTAVTYDGPN